MDRRGFLKMLAGGAAAVGAAFALPRTVEGAVTAPATPLNPPTITLPENHGFTGATVLGPYAGDAPIQIENRTFIGSWDLARGNGVTMGMAGYVDADGVYQVTSTSFVSDETTNHTHPISFPDYDENWPIYEHGRSLLGVHYGSHPKPSGDLVDW